MVITAHTRGLIGRALHEPGATWQGTRGGVEMKLTHSRQPDLDGNRIEWQMRTGAGRWTRGKSSHPTAAIDAIQVLSKGARTA